MPLIAENVKVSPGAAHKTIPGICNDTTMIHIAEKARLQKSPPPFCTFAIL